MRRMITQKQVEALDYLKDTVYNGDDDITNIAGPVRIIDKGEVYGEIGLKLGSSGAYDTEITLGSNDVTITGDTILNGSFTAQPGGYKAMSIIYNESDERMDVNFPDITQITFDDATTIIIPMLPTSDPHVAGALWNDNGTLKISSGS